MNKAKLKEFLKDPIVRQAYREDGLEEVARLASMIGNLDKDPELRRLAEDISSMALNGRGRR